MNADALTSLATLYFGLLICCRVNYGLETWRLNECSVSSDSVDCTGVRYLRRLPVVAGHHQRLLLVNCALRDSQLTLLLSRPEITIPNLLDLSGF